MKNLTRQAFTLVELLIVIAIIGTLMALLLPAVHSARERARQVSCNNNLGQIAQAMISYSTNGKGVFPGWMQLQKLSPTAADKYTPTPLANGPDIEISWAAKLLPHLDAKATWESLLMGNLDLANPSIMNAADQVPKIDLFICPSNPSTRPNEPSLSYVVNAGAADRVRANGDPPSDYAANGICHDLRTGPAASAQLNPMGPTVRSSSIKDGSATTLLLSENNHKEETGLGVFTSWLRSSATLTAPNFGEQVYGMVWVYDANGSHPTYPALVPRPGVQERFNMDGLQPDTYSDLGATYARPSSNHTDLFLVAFVGGNTGSIRQSIDYRVYQQLMTPNGAKCQWPADPSVELSEEVPAFRNADSTLQLSDSDY